MEVKIRIEDNGYNYYLLCLDFPNGDCKQWGFTSEADAKNAKNLASFCMKNSIEFN